VLWGGDGPKEAPPDGPTRALLLALVGDPASGLQAIIRRRLDAFMTE
jgi:hypothetical protein